MRRYLILSASMGDGHLRVAAELRRRLAARGHAVEVVDILGVLPFGLGPMLRAGYAAMLAHAPSVYEAIYRGFFEPAGQPGGLRPDPLVAVSAPAVRRLIESRQPDTVVSTFHLCGQIAGRLRADGAIAATSVVFVTDFVAHRMWLHPGNDAFICPHPEVAAQAAAGTGRPAFAAAPAVGEAFLDGTAKSGARDRVRSELAIPRAAPVVLVSAGAWGAGEIRAAVAAVAASDHVTVVLCGRNEELRRAVESPQRSSSGVEGVRVVTLGWRDDVADVMRACDVLVENAGGQTAMEALAVGLPVVTYRPLPGHGRDGARHMRDLGLTSLVADRSELQAMIRELAAPRSPQRARRVGAGRALFTVDPVEFLDPAVVVS